MPSRKTRKELSINGLIKFMKSCFCEISDNSKGKIPLSDILMSAFAMFSLKDQSLLDFDRRRYDPEDNNLKSVYGIEDIPSDTAMRERLDELDPEELRPIFTALFSKLQRGKLLEDMTYLGDYYLCSIDGSGYFSSDSVHCSSCMKKKHKQSGEVCYYHQMLTLAIVHPEIKEVIPLNPEPIILQDGENKNDCERNACRRALKKLREDHSKLKLLIVEDGLSSNAPHIEDLQEYGMSYILGAKQSDHEFLFQRAREHPSGEYEFEDKNFIHKFSWANQVPLNKMNWKLNVNFLEYWETNKKTGKVQHFSWVTDQILKEENVYKVMRAGRSRWRIENEVFNTLKNQGYNFEHNYGHGNKNLSVVFALIMMLAFFVDQVQQKSCWLFKKALEKIQVRTALWEEMRTIFRVGIVDSMESILMAIAYGYEKVQIKHLYRSTG